MAKEKDHVIFEYHLNKNQPDKPQVAIHDLREYLNKHQSDTTKPHIHSFYQVIWFKSGKGRHFVDFKGYDVFENAIIFVSKNQVHYFDNNMDYEGFLIHFNEAFLVQNESESDFLLKSNLFNNPYQQPSCCIGKGIHGMLDQYIDQCKEELENPEDFGKEELLRNYLKSFLIQILRKRNEVDTDGQSASIVDEKRMQLNKFINLIDENYTKGLSVAEYAGLIFVSSRTLSDLTHQLLNKTPSQMVQERIILEAQRLLLYSNLNVNQIGYRLGFDDPSYFVKYFKKHASLSPSEFRKSVS